MTPLAEFIAEEFHSKVDLNWILKDRSHVCATFSVSTILVQVSFEQREENGAWHVSFDVERGEESERTHLAFHIFNGLFQCVREFLEVRQPGAVVFATKRDELASVYQTYLRRERATLQALGYELGPAQKVHPYVEFTLRRVAASEWK